LFVPEGGSCTLGGQWLDFPAVAGAHPISAESHDVLVEQGKTPENTVAATVGCTWYSQEDPYRAELVLLVADTGGTRFLSLAPDLSVGVPRERAFRVDVPGNELRTTDDAKCTFTGIEIDLAKQSLWGSMHCPVLTNDAGTERCEGVTGTFYFENCKPR
jgi:hypothetical protein